jgi:aryl-phospho-beta-D-glucosidase BglC (GH1 family)
MKKLHIFFLLIVAIITFSVSCKKSETIPTPPVATSLVFTISPDSLKFTVAGGNFTVTDSMNGSRWAATSDQTWCTLSANSSTSATSQITVTATANPDMGVRTAKLMFVMDSKTVKYVYVSQVGRTTLYPSYNTTPITPDATGMSSTAVQLVAKMGLGWNIGNTMEAPGGETGWGNPPITEDYVKFVKQSGFNAIRIPCAWYLHMDNKSTAHINTDWLNRVKQVVQYCISNDMYVLLNIHWDGGWLEQNCTTAKKDSVNAMQKAFWEQIATTMRDFDEHLMFASANEPNTNSSAVQMNVLLSYHQTFINAVRSTGGKNTYRSLVIQGDSKLISVNAFPTDPTPNRIMFEEHNYTPFQFCALDGDASWGKMFYYWGAGHHSTIEPDRNPNWDCEENAQTLYFQGIKANFIDKGIPVLMGEYGAYRRDGSANIPKDLPTHEASVDYWITFTTKTAITNGLKPFFWDTGGILDRSNNTVKDQRSLDAIIAGSK